MCEAGAPSKIVQTTTAAIVNATSADARTLNANVTAAATSASTPNSTGCDTTASSAANSATRPPTAAGSIRASSDRGARPTTDATVTASPTMASVAAFR